MKKIGIVTSAKELNYGAILQAYALQTVTESLGYDVCLLWWSNQRNSHKDIRIKKIIAMFFRYLLHPAIVMQSVRTYKKSFEKNFSERSADLFQRFEDNNLKIEYMNYNQMKKYASNDNCKALIAGSDQIWNSYAVYVDSFYYLRFAEEEKRVAYAPSFGKETIPQYNKSIMRKYISGFKRLSVREKNGNRIIKDLLGIDVPVVLDPTFLLTENKWRNIGTEVETPKEYVLIYFLDKPDDSCLRMIEDIVRSCRLPVLALPYRIWDSNIQNVTYVHAGPSEFITLIDKANIVLTDSFHGTVFSIIFQKRFYTFERQYGSNQSQSSRLIDLFELCGIEKVFIQKEMTLEEILKISISADDYRDVHEIIDKQRTYSLNYLRKALGCEDF